MVIGPQRSVKSGKAGKTSQDKKKQRKKQPRVPSSVLSPILMRPMALPTNAAAAPPRIKSVRARKAEAQATRFS